MRYGANGVAFGYLRNIGENDPEDSTYSLLKKYMTEEEKKVFDIFLSGKGKWLMNENESTLFTKQFFRATQKDPGKYETVDDTLYRKGTEKAKETFENRNVKVFALKKADLMVKNLMMFVKHLYHLIMLINRVNMKKKITFSKEKSLS